MGQAGSRGWGRSEQGGEVEGGGLLGSGEGCSWFGLNSVRLGRPQGDVLIIVLRRTGSIPVVSNSSFDSSDSLCHMLV